MQRRAQPDVSAVHYEGAAKASPSPVLVEGLDQAQLLVICPSNPALSVHPIVALAGMKERPRQFFGDSCSRQSHSGQRRGAGARWQDNGWIGTRGVRGGSGPRLS